MHRRRFLAAGGAVLVAGCTNPLSGDPEVAIGSVIYRNDTDSERTVQLLLRRLDDDEDHGFDVVYDERVTVPAMSVDIVEADWTTEPHEYELLYATADELNMLRVPKDVSAYIDEDGCNHIMAQFSEPDGLTMWVSNDLPIDDELPSC